MTSASCISESAIVLTETFNTIDTVSSRCINEGTFEARLLPLATVPCTARIDSLIQHHLVAAGDREKETDLSIRTPLDASDACQLQGRTSAQQCSEAKWENLYSTTSVALMRRVALVVVGHFHAVDD